MYYEASVRIERPKETGGVKKVTEKYLCDAVCVSEVELRVSELLKPFVTDVFAVNSVKKSAIEEVLNPDCDRFYSVRYGVEVSDEKTGAIKQVTNEILVGAGDFYEALERFKTVMNSYMADWELLSISLSQILEIVRVK